SGPHGNDVDADGFDDGQRIGLAGHGELGRTGRHRPHSSDGGSSPRISASTLGRSSGLTSTSRAFEPSDGPTTPRVSSRSINRPALAKPTRSLRCNIDVEPNCELT